LKFIIGLANAARIYLYFDVVERLAWSNDAESYAAGSVATTQHVSDHSTRRHMYRDLKFQAHATDILTFQFPINYSCVD